MPYGLPDQCQFPAPYINWMRGAAICLSGTIEHEGPVDLGIAPSKMGKTAIYGCDDVPCPPARGKQSRRRGERLRITAGCRAGP